jgi:5-methyltetrahydropteroyltriglutamate--homocysteine methyltransferase
LRAGRFYVQLASEADPERVLTIIKENLKEGQFVFVGVIDPINPKVEEVDLIEERVMQAAKHLPVPQLGTTDDCGFSPFADDTSTSRDIAFQKIRARVLGTRSASAFLNRTPSVAAS